MGVATFWKTHHLPLSNDTNQRIINSSLNHPAPVCCTGGIPGMWSTLIGSSVGTHSLRAGNYLLASYPARNLSPKVCGRIRLHRYRICSRETGTNQRNLLRPSPPVTLFRVFRESTCACVQVGLSFKFKRRTCSTTLKLNELVDRVSVR